MSIGFGVRRTRGRVLVVALLAIASAALVTLPARAAKEPSPPKLYSASFVVEDAAGDALTFTFTITNESPDAADLGLVNIFVPKGFTAIGAPTIVEVSDGKTWTATRQGNTITLQAVSDADRLAPGESVVVEFTATPPAGARSFTFTTAAKASGDFTGSSGYRLVGGNPSLVICPDSGTCTATLGNPSDAPPDQQTGSVTLEDECPGCILTITSTPGNFCSEGELPADCQSPLVIRFNFAPSYSGNVTVVLTCDVTDCPEIIEPDPCPECEFSIASELATYPVFFTDSDENTESTEVIAITEFCDSGEFEFAYEGTGPPCIEQDIRLPNGDLQATVLLEFFNGVDPRIAR